MNKYFIEVLKNHYADFTGIATRKQYWLFTLWLGIVSLVIILLFSLFIESSQSLQFLFLLYSLALDIPTWAITVRRIRDAGLNLYCGLLMIPQMLLQIISLVIILGSLSYDIPIIKAIIFYLNLANVLCGFTLIGICVCPSKK